MSPPLCPICGLPCPLTDTDSRALPTGAPTCNPIRSPGCWRIEQTYDHDLGAWVLTHDPGEPAPTVEEFRERARWEAA